MTRARKAAATRGEGDPLAPILAALGDRWPVVTGPGWVLVHGDCREVLPALPDGCATHRIDDPPYSEHTHAKQWDRYALQVAGGKRFKNPPKTLSFAPLTAEVRDFVAAQSARLVERWSIAFSDVEWAHEWRDSFLAAGLDAVRTCLWVKPDASPQFTGDRPAVAAEAFVVAHPAGRKRWNAGGKRNVYTHGVNNFGRVDRPHPTSKPIDLMLEILADFTDPGDVVLDCFAGSATTGVGCLRLGRMFIGIERLPLPGLPIDDETNPDFFGIACRRMRGDEARPREQQPGLFDLATGVTNR